jgi:chromate transporter
VVAGLIIATGMKLIPALRKNPIGRTLGLAWVIIGFVVVALLRVPLAVSLLTLGGTACVWAWWQLRRQEEAA